MLKAFKGSFIYWQQKLSINGSFGFFKTINQKYIYIFFFHEAFNNLEL